MSENIIQRAIRRIRPGSGGPSKAISIIDGQTGRAPTIAPTRTLDVDDEDFDDQRSGMPLALGLEMGVGPNVSIIPSGTLAGVDPRDGKIPSYAPDDSAVLFRLFGQRISDD